MRILVLPVSRRQALAHWQNIGAPPVRTTTRLDDRILKKADQIWNGFAKSDTKWKLSIVKWGNAVLERIPLEEWSLKSVPPLGTYKRKVDPTGEWEAAWPPPSKEEEAPKLQPVQLVYPSTALTAEKAESILSTLANDGVRKHRSRLIWSTVALPFTIPVALIPVVPNLPAFYLMFRMYSHWMAMRGAKHIQTLIEARDLVPVTLPALDATYEDNGKETFGGPSGSISDLQVDRISRIFASVRLTENLERAVRQVRSKSDKNQKSEVDTAKVAEKDADLARSKEKAEGTQ